MLEIDNKYKFYVLKEENDYIEHEKLLYDAFTNRSYDKWINNNYSKIDNCRLKSPIPYHDQLILGMKESDELKLSIAINVNNNRKMQLESIGFNRNNIDFKKKFAEGLTFCTIGGAVPSNFFKLFESFNIFFNNQMKENGIEIIYSTSNVKLKIFYLRMGFTIISELNNEDGKELLLQKIINK